MSAPDPSPASTTTTISDRAAIVQLRAGKFWRRGTVPSGNWLTSAPPVERISSAAGRSAAGGGPPRPPPRAHGVPPPGRDLGQVVLPHLIAPFHHRFRWRLSLYGPGTGDMGNHAAEVRARK